MSGSSIYSPFGLLKVYSIVFLRKCLIKEFVISVNIWKAVSSKWYSITSFSCFGYTSHTKILLYGIITLQARLVGPAMGRV